MSPKKLNVTWSFVLFKIMLQENYNRNISSLIHGILNLYGRISCIFSEKIKLQLFLNISRLTFSIKQLSI